MVAISLCLAGSNFLLKEAHDHQWRSVIGGALNRNGIFDQLVLATWLFEWI